MTVYGNYDVIAFISCIQIFTVKQSMAMIMNSIIYKESPTYYVNSTIAVSSYTITKALADEFILVAYTVKSRAGARIG